MTTSTPNLSLILYNSTTDSAEYFSNFRATIAGTSLSSNFYKIDTAYGNMQTEIDSIQAGAYLTLANFISSNYYEATVTGITSYNVGMKIILSLDTASAGTVTLNINSLGIKSVMKINSSGTPVNITSGELMVGKYYFFAYDGTRWVWVDSTSGDQIYVSGTSGNVVTLNSDNTLLGTTTQTALISGTTHSASSKTTPEDSDEIGILDSAASYILKKLSISNLKTSIKNYIDSLDDGWIPSSEAWTFSSADDSTTVVSADENVTGKYQNGMRIKYDQVQALTAYWDMNTNSNSQVGSFNGTDTSMTYTSGKFSNAATFNGTSSKIVFSDSSSLKPTNEFTLGLWFKTSTTGTEKGLFQSFSQSGSYSGFCLRISTGNVLEYTVGNNTGTVSGTNFIVHTGTTTVTDNAYHYVVISYRNNYLQIFLDGVPEIFGYSLSPAYAGTTYIRIGTRNLAGTDASYMNGQIDDVFLINGYALSEKDVYSKYLANTAQGTSDLTITKNALITHVGDWTGTETPLTFWGGNEFSTKNTSISNIHYSNSKVPYGFDVNPDKWAVLLTNTVNNTQVSPTAGTWYNVGSLSIPIPIGSWNVSWQAIIWLDITTQASLQGALSSSTSSATDSSLVTYQISAATTIAALKANASGILKKSSKTTYYLIATTSTSGATNLRIRGDASAIKIYVLSSYL